jgi:hypothetical protein
VILMKLACDTWYISPSLIKFDVRQILCVLIRLLQSDWLNVFRIDETKETVPILKPLVGPFLTLSVI